MAISDDTRSLQMESLKLLPENTSLHEAWLKFARVEHTLESGRMLCMDGGVGSEIQKRDLDTKEHDQWGYPAHIHNPDGVRSIHEDYAKCGAQIMIANTYPANKHVMANRYIKNPSVDVTDVLVRQANIAGVKVARDAATQYSSAEKPIYVAGSISTHPPDIPQSEIKTTEFGNWPKYPDEEFANYLAQAQALRDAGVDFIFMEMLKDKEHALRAIKAASTTRLPIFAGLTLALGDNNEVVLRDDPSVTLEEAVEMFNNITGVVGFNIMHCDMKNVEEYIKKMRQLYTGIIGVYPEIGKYEFPLWTVPESTTAETSPELFVEHAKRWGAVGANMIGGCCGVGPDHISALSKWIESESKPHKWNLADWLKSPTIPEWLHLPRRSVSASHISKLEEEHKKEEICAGAGGCQEYENLD